MTARPTWPSLAPGSPPSIGIGGHLAAPPLPHHRAYGSVPRRFGGLSVHQFRHGKQAQTTETGVGEGAVQGFREAQPPGAFGTEDGRTGRPVGDPKATELMVAMAARLPLDPGNATQRRRIQPSSDGNSRDWLKPK